MRRALAALAASITLALGGAACDRSTPEPAPTAHPQVAKSATPARAKAPAFSSKISRPRAPRVVAIGDLHGDIGNARKALRLAGAVDEHDHWVGGKLVVVQTGDEVDRGDGDRAILDLVERLKTEAKQAGGELIALLGNHELMNVSGDFRYVTPGGASAFGGENGRRLAFAPGGTYARLLARRPLFVKVGDTVFVHGGINTKVVSHGLDALNDEVHAWLLGKRTAPPSLAVAEDGPVWLRAYSQSTTPSDCAELGRALAAMGAKRMVVGHTVQSEGISSACDQRVWRIDVGISHFYGGAVQILEIAGDKVKPLSG